MSSARHWSQINKNRWGTAAGCIIGSSSFFVEKTYVGVSGFGIFNEIFRGINKR